ncbi:MAG: glycosyltransferase [Patescibacteria group bacterium]|nr:glycosyltransferase [Patescibacteria group bacterium]
MKRRKIAIVRGKFLNRYEMQFFEPLTEKFDITGFGSRCPYHDTFSFPVVKLFSPVDLPDFPKKMPFLNRIWGDAHVLFSLEPMLQGFDLVHAAETYFYYTQQCLNAKKRGYVKHVVATVLENIPFNNEGIRGRTAMKQRAIKELDHLIALTERTKLALLLEGADEKKITVIPHFIDTQRFVPRNREEKRPNKPLNILFCGRLERYKGVYELLYAVKMLRADYNIVMTFVGDGSEKANMIELEKKLGIERFVVHKQVSYDDMPYEYQQADIYVAPSKETETWQEQYNTTLLEAQASGLPIVTTSSGGIPENVGDAALLANPGDVYSLLVQLRRFLDSEALRLSYGKKARDRAVRVHDKQIGAKKIEDVWSRFV